MEGPRDMPIFVAVKCLLLPSILAWCQDKESVPRFPYLSRRNAAPGFS